MSIAVLPKSSASPSTTVSLTGPPPTLPTPLVTFLKWLELTTGRDKLLRLIQYSSKFIIQTLRDLHYSNDIIDRLTKGASSVGQTRKLIRFFRSLEFLNDFLKATAIVDEFERIAAMIRAFSFCMWMLMDHVQWMQKAGYIKLDNIKTVDTVHSQSWFYGLFVSAVICVYKLTALNIKREKLLQTITAAPNSGIATTSSSTTVDASPSASMASIDAERQKQMMGVVKNGLDMVIPAARLGWINVSDGTVGIAGSITSAIGIYDTWPKGK